jgi:hypothetical protein
MMLLPNDKSTCKVWGQKWSTAYKKRKLYQLLGATQQNQILTQIFLYETLPALTNINSTLMQAS